MKRTKDEIMEDFIDLACALSPENLYRDGEASSEDVKQSLTSINQEWKSLETEIGYKVTETDVWQYSREQKEKLRQQQTPPIFTYEVNQKDAPADTTHEVTEKQTPVVTETTTAKKKNFFGI